MDQPNIQQAGKMKFLLLSASLRHESLNSKLIKLASEIILRNNGEADIAHMSEFDCGSFNQDLEVSQEIPDGAVRFRDRLLANNAFIVSSPEYNASMPGNLKNAIDWVSRFRPQPFNEKHALLMSASPSMVGGNRGLWSLRVPFEHLGARVFPDMFSLATAHKAFSPGGGLMEATIAKRFENNLVAFMSLAEAATHYPCMKKTWVEFLGEQPDPATEREE